MTNLVTIPEGAFQYDFPDSWIAVKFDDLSFYRDKFQGFAGGTKAVDVVAVEPETFTLWLIEAKDFRGNERGKKLPVTQELAEKVRGTLACLMAGRANAGNTGNEGTDRLWEVALRQSRIRFAFHFEQPDQHSRLFPQSIDPKTIKDILDRAVRVASPKPIAGGTDQINQKQLGWRIRTR